MDLVVYQSVGTLSIGHDFLSSWDCLLAPSPDSLCELSWQLTQCSAASLKAACVQRLKKEIQGPERLLWCSKGHTRFRAACRIRWGVQGFRGSDSWQTFYGKDDQIHPQPQSQSPIHQKKRLWEQKTIADSGRPSDLHCAPRPFSECAQMCAKSVKSLVFSLDWPGMGSICNDSHA